MLPKSRILYFGLFLCLITDAVQAKPSRETQDKKETKNYNKNEEFPEEDTDMLMEPNEFSPITILRSQERHFHEPPSTQFRPIPNPRYISKTDVQAHANPLDSHTQAAQNYYPPFFREAPPLGHSRPYFTLSDGPLIPKFAEARPEGNLGPGLAPHQRAVGFDHSILGSGDFGVIRGGTFYPEEEMPYHPEDSIDYVQKYTYPEEQFAHFRDFADINTPVDTAFSHYVVVYQAKNATKSSKHPHPKNIFEQLELLDKEKADEERKLKKSKQTSKSKTKLAKTVLQQKKYKTKAASVSTTTPALALAAATTLKDIDEEPLLALS